MLDKLFGAGSGKEAGPGRPGGEAAPAAPRQRRVNLEKRFTIIAETGQGSMSRVYRAVDNPTGSVVCLKVQDKEKSIEASARAAAGKPSEGDIGLRIRHPNVVRTLEHGETNRGEHFVVMEFIDGVSMQFVRSMRPDMTLAAKLELLAQTADGLGAVHKAGFIHHDFGPKNVLIDREDRIKLIDFGLTVPNTPEFRRPGNRTGTLNYMAPELLRREPTDERLDIFSFGVTAFELLTGKLPYEAATSMEMMLRRINTVPLDIAQADPRLPEEICAIVRKAMARSVKERYASMDEIARDLRALPLLAMAEAEADEPKPLSPAAVADADDFLGALGIDAPGGGSNVEDDFLDALGVEPVKDAPPPAVDPAPAPAPPAAPRPAPAASSSAQPRAGIPKDVQREVWRRDAGRCVECGATEGLRFKHLVPIAQGGTETADNIRLLCQPCRHKLRADPRPDRLG